MNDTELYTAMQRNCDFNIGDTVKVLRTANNEECGWDNDWDSGMDDSVGRQYKVIGIDDTEGVYLNNWYYYPWFVLEKTISSSKTGGDVYTKSQKLCGLKVGDTVKVLRKAVNYENGWDTTWEKGMNKCIGEEFKILTISNRFGYFLCDSDHYFPWFVLEKVEPKVKEIDYTLEWQDTKTTKPSSNRWVLTSTSKDIFTNDTFFIRQYDDGFHDSYVLWCDIPKENK